MTDRTRGLHDATSPTPRVARRRRAGRAPLPLLVPAALGFLFLVAPFVALLVRSPWGDLGSLVTSQRVLQALWLSLRTATAATVVCLVLGVPLAWVLARTTFPGQNVVRSIVTMPLVMPPVVGGVALLSLLGRRGLLGSPLDTAFGITIPFTTLAVVIAEAFVALPFLVLSVDGSLRSADLRYEQAAAVLGASRWYVFRRVTLPLVGPSVAAGGVLCFARALGEFGATITFAGNFPGTTQTMPLAIYLAMQDDPSTALALSLVLMAVSLAVLIGLRSRWVSGLIEVAS
ncbi:ABC transporter permease [Cellulomonas sp. C5510]|uniref:ABC transporter permease n=1 Tax=Cellulomonas sp. C5510 TaxID=2871170 RepID=UPI001C93C6C3|nr:ABC transporter permease [Cellulomonas sp. C5510]QZN84885.1 ABC transporter permease [Cellulomonas sp. C5510]